MPSLEMAFDFSHVSRSILTPGTRHLTLSTIHSELVDSLISSQLVSVISPRKRGRSRHKRGERGRGGRGEATGV